MYSFKIKFPSTTQQAHYKHPHYPHPSLRLEFHRYLRPPLLIRRLRDLPITIDATAIVDESGSYAIISMPINPFGTY